MAHVVNLQALCSIANQLAENIPEYRDALLAVPESARQEQDVLTLFNAIIVEPLKKVPSRMKNLLVVLDALDESDSRHRRALLDILAKRWQDELPDWLGVVVSTRPEHPIRPRLHTFKPKVRASEI